MKLVIKELQDRQRYTALSFLLKAKYFWTLKKRRFFYIFLIYMAYKYNERFTNWVTMRKARAINKYKRRWLHRYNP